MVLRVYRFTPTGSWIRKICTKCQLPFIVNENHLDSQDIYSVDKSYIRYLRIYHDGFKGVVPLDSFIKYFNGARFKFTQIFITSMETETH